MANLYLIPSWFFGYDVFLEVLFGIIALFVAMYAFKVYRISQQREPGLLGVSFLLISFSYFAWSIINLLLVEELSETMKILVLREVNILSVVGIYSHILLFMTGLVTLFYMTCRVRSDKMYSLLVIFSLLVVLLSLNKVLALQLLSSIILLYVATYYGTEYKKKKEKRAGLTFLAFVLFLMANSLLIFAGNYYGSYVIAHLLQLGSFGIILGNLLSILKNGKKKK